MRREGYWKEHYEKNKEKLRLKSQKWKEKNRDKVNEYARDYYYANKDECNKKKDRWRKNNPEKATLHQKASTANRRYPGKITVQDIRDILEKQGRKCYWCGKANLEGRDFTLEHLRPNNSQEDVAIACLSCNTAKVHKTGKLLTPKEKLERKKENRRRDYYKNAEVRKKKSMEWAIKNRERLRLYQKEYREKQHQKKQMESKIR